MKGTGWWLVLAALSVISCGDSGQTGSPSCSGPQACECAALAGRVLVKATVLAEDGDQISLRIEEQLDASAAASPSQLVNKHLEGALTMPTSCWPASATFEVGESVFATFYTGDQCPTYYGCAINCYSAPNSQRLDPCLDECASQCEPNTIFASPWLQPWGDTIAISPATTVTIAEAIALSDPKACDQRFPPPPAAPCHDTLGGGEGGCSLSSTSDHSGIATGLLAALVGVYIRRRHRQRRVADSR